MGVDNDGFIFLSFEAADVADEDVFKWNKNYGKAIDAGRARLENKNNRSYVPICHNMSTTVTLFSVASVLEVCFSFIFAIGNSTVLNRESTYI